MRRGAAVLLAVVVVAAGAFATAAWVAGGDDESCSDGAHRHDPAGSRTAAHHLPGRVHGPGDGRPRGRSAQDRDLQAARDAASDQVGYLRAVERALPPSRFRKDVKRDSFEGFLFPASYEFTQRTTARELVADQINAFKERFRGVDLRYARSKNLTPYDILIIASMIEKETAVPRERRLVAAVIYNRLRNRMPLGIDATIRYGLGNPGNRVADEGGAPVVVAVQHPPAGRASADADREPRPRLDPCGGKPGPERRVPLLRAQAEVARPLLHVERERLPPEGLRVRLRVRLIARAIRRRDRARCGAPARARRAGLERARVRARARPRTARRCGLRARAPRSAMWRAGAPGARARAPCWPRTAEGASCRRCRPSSRYRHVATSR